MYINITIYNALYLLGSSFLIHDISRYLEVCERDLDCMNGGKCLPDKTCKCVKFVDGFRCVSSGKKL